MTTIPAPSHLKRVEGYVFMRLNVSSPQELRRFLASPWAASILMPEEMTELYTELHSQEEAPRDATEAGLVEVGQD